MDAIDFILYLIIAILVLILLFMGYLLVLAAVKKLSANRKGFFWIYRLVPHYLKEPDWEESLYLNKYRPRIDTYLGCFATINDDVIIEVAKQLADMTFGKSESYKEAFLLAFVQQNVAYRKDYDQYKVSDHWVFPVNTLRMHKGDCEDSTFLYASLAYNMGLDCCIALVPKHCVPGVKEGKNGSYFNYKPDPSAKPIKYYFVETTSFIPLVGMYSSAKSPYVTSPPRPPTAEFSRGILPIKYFKE